MSASESWLVLPSHVPASLEAEVAAGAARDFAEGNYRPEDVSYVRDLDLSVVRENVRFPEARLERIRRLCQVWDVDIKQGEITSHRPIIGKFIVTGKKLLFPIVRVLFKDFIRQQRTFNSEVIALLSELSNEVADKRSRS